VDGWRLAVMRWSRMMKKAPTGGLFGLDDGEWAGTRLVERIWPKTGWEKPSGDLFPLVFCWWLTYLCKRSE